MQCRWHSKNSELKFQAEVSMHNIFYIGNLKCVLTCYPQVEDNARHQHRGTECHLRIGERQHSFV
jgi:hypothetical protein